MNKDQEMTLEEVLCATRWRTIIIPLVLLLLVVAAFVFFSVRTAAQQSIIVVHTGESKTLHYNPGTHDEVRNEMADGNVMLTVKPKE